MPPSALLYSWLGQSELLHQYEIYLRVAEAPLASPSLRLWADSPVHSGLPPRSIVGYPPVHSGPPPGPYVGYLPGP
ncbi:unnamed protein product [Boreogadus saida]